jgi:RNA polymerase sigma-70 factor (ECF subfamily)
MERSVAIREEELLAQMGWVSALARSLLSDEGLADDVAQDAWVVATERPPRARQGAGLKAWLASLTRTLARQSVRSTKRRKLREQSAAKPEAVAPDSSIVERGALQERVVRAVMELEEPYRSTVLLRYLDGLSAPQIAARSGESPAVVRKRLERALERLRLKLDSAFDGNRRAWAVAALSLVSQNTARIGKTGILTMAKSTIGSISLAAFAATILVGTYLISRSSTHSSEPSSSPAHVSGAAGASPKAIADAQIPTSRAPATVSRASEPAPIAVGEASPNERLSSELDNIAQSFLTDQPEVDRLADVFDAIGRVATIVPGSISSKAAESPDPAAGPGATITTRRTTGSLLVPGTNITAQFETNQRGTRITIQSDGKTPLRKPFMQRDVSMFLGPPGSPDQVAHLYVQFQPDSRTDSSDVLGAEEEAVIGWAVGYDAKGMGRQALTMARGPEAGSWRIGFSEKRPEEKQEGVVKPACFDTWYRLLDPVVR